MEPIKVFEPDFLHQKQEFFAGGYFPVIDITFFKINGLIKLTTWKDFVLFHMITETTKTVDVRRFTGFKKRMKHPFFFQY